MIIIIVTKVTAMIINIIAVMIMKKITVVPNNKNDCKQKS
jgi:hypothetical protein